MPSIVRRPRKNGSTSYQVRWREDGRVRSETLDTEADARDFKLLLERSSGDSGLAERILKERYEQGPTVAEAMHDHIKHLTNVGPYMLKRYEDYVRLYFSGTTGELKAATITQRDVVAWIRYMQSKGLSVKTIKNVGGFLSATMTTCVNTGIRESNPCKGVKYPKETSHEEKTTFLTKEEWGKLFAAIDPHYQPLFGFLVGTGLRFGEAAALYASDFNLESVPATVRVVKAYKTDGEGRLYLGTPKTKKGVRTVSLAPSTVALIRPLVEEAGSSHVFRNKRGGVLMSTTVNNNAWRPAVARADIGRRVRVHDLRHTHASWMLAAGLDMYTLSARLGHSSIQMSIDLYSHVMPDAQFAGSQAATRALGEIA